jgi:hypothetical protein
MDYLEERLERLIKKGRGKSPMAGFVRDQIAARARGQSAQEMYIVGMAQRDPGLKRDEKKEAEQPKGYAAGGLVSRYDPSTIDQIVNRVRGAGRG